MLKHWLDCKTLKILKRHEKVFESRCVPDIPFWHIFGREVAEMSVFDTFLIEKSSRCLFLISFWRTDRCVHFWHVFGREVAEMSILDMFFAAQRNKSVMKIPAERPCGAKNPIKGRETVIKMPSECPKKILWKIHELLWKYSPSGPARQKHSMTSYEIDMKMPAGQPCCAKNSIKSHDIVMKMLAERTWGAKIRKA